MKGLGKSITGTEITQDNISNFARSVEPSHRGSLSSWPMAMQIKEFMMLGGVFNLCTHLYNIMKSMKPKKHTINTRFGIHSKTRSTVEPKWMALLNFRNTPT